VWTALGLDPATTLHDVRYGEHFKGGDVDGFVWVFEISGSAPPSHFKDGWKGARYLSTLTIAQRVTSLHTAQSDNPLCTSLKEVAL
jgi:hypothetical protein